MSCLPQARSAPDDRRPPLLAYVEDSLPGGDAAARRRLAHCHGLALEAAFRGGRLQHAPAPARPPGGRNAAIVTVQAWDLHHDPPLHPEGRRRAAAARHVAAALEAAARVGAGRVVTICSYGPAVADRPRERCLDFFGGLAGRAHELGVRILIEPLSPSRAGVMSSPAEIQDLLQGLAAPGVFGAVLDTGHLLDSGLEPAAVIAGWRGPLDEIQLRGAGSAPPAPGDPLESWLAAAPALPPVVAVEHGQDTTPGAVADLVARLRRLPGLAGT